MRWHFGICPEARKQQSITFHLALYFSFLLLLIYNNRLRIWQREALCSPTAWPYIFTSCHVGSTYSCCSTLQCAFLLEKWRIFGDGDALELYCSEDLEVHFVLNLSGSGHQSNLKQRNPQKLHDFTDLSYYNVILPLMDRRASSLALFILLSALYLRMPVFKIQTYLVMRYWVVYRPPVMFAFTHYSDIGMLFL